MTIKFIALDTDGTLLNSTGKILPSTKKAVKTALDQGIKVALCSGRPIAGLKHFMDELGIIGPDQYAITLNGAITRTADGKIMTKDLVSNRLYRKMYAFANEHHLPFNVVSPDSKIITGDHDVDLMVLQFKLPKFNAIKISDKTFYLIHGDDDTYDIKELKENEILLKGHTHIPLMQKLGKGIYLNPGSMTFPKGSLDKSYMIFTDDDIKLIEFEYDNNDNPCIKSEKYYSKEQKIYNKLG